jgi:hypothetical protein
MEPDFRAEILAADPPHSRAVSDGDGEDSPSGDRSTGFHRLVAEAKEALGAVITGELVYYQRSATFTAATDTADLRLELGVLLDEPSRRWLFDVHDASATGFLASARGRDDTEAENALVTVRYVRGQPPLWTVRRRAR